MKFPIYLCNPPGVIPAGLNPTTLLLRVYSGKVAAGQSRWVSAAQDYDGNDEGSLTSISISWKRLRPSMNKCASEWRRFLG